MSPIVRLRIQAPPPDYPRVPLAFTFISTYDSILPTSILPPASTSHPATFVSSSLPKSESSLPSEPMSTRPTNYQDILIFDPADGILSLRRFTIELRTHDRGLSIPTPLPGLSPTSISLPGMSPSRLSASSPSGPGKSGLTRMMESPPELIGRDNVIATWSLQRHRDWGDIQQVLHDSAEEIVGRPPISGGKGE